MSGSPLASVIIPAYNVAPYIRLSVQSVLAQSVRDVEVIVVDDGSTDGTLQRLLGIRDERLRIIRRQHAGPAGSRNEGVALARARYIGFLDADDLWAPDKLRRHLDVLDNHPEVDLTFSFSAMIDESGRRIGLPGQGRAGRISFVELLRENLARNGSAVVVRTEALARAGSFDAALPGVEDHDMWLRVARLRQGNVYCIPRILTFYRRRAGQLSGDWRRMRASWLRLREKMRALAGEETRKTDAWAGSCMNQYFASLAFEAEEFREASSLLRVSFKRDPRRWFRSPRAWLLAGACLSGRLLPSVLHRRLVDAVTRGAQAVQR